MKITVRFFVAVTFFASTVFANEFSASYFVFTSDPQYPWTKRTDEGLSEDQGWAKQESETLIRTQYNSVNQVHNTYGKQLKAVFINGDLTAFGHYWQLQTMYPLFRILTPPYYLGIGNHDYKNNVDDCFENRCASDSVMHFINEMKQKPLDSFDYDKWDYDRSISHITEVTGSLAYSKNFDNVHMVQLNNCPTYERRWGEINTSSVFQPRMYVYKITSSLNWLEKDLATARAQGKIIILNMHEPNFEDCDPTQAPTFLDMLKKYKVSAIFAGHYHQLMGKFDNSFASGTTPVFLSGSASQSTYLIAEIDEKNSTMTVYGVRNNDPTLILEDSVAKRDFSKDDYDKNFSIDAPKEKWIVPLLR